MTTIDKLDISVHNTYAIRTLLVEQINKQLHLEQAGTIPAQTQVVNMAAQWTELTLLLGFGSRYAPWAIFFPPKKFYDLRRSPFTFSRVMPSFGSSEECFEKLREVDCHTPDEEKERMAIVSCLQQLDRINDWMSHIVGRVGQFLQG